jgi:SAM-dependent methyltransferase
MHTLIFEVALVLSAVVVAHAQEPKQTPKDVWNRIYTNAKDSKSSYNSFLAEVIKERKPGKAFDIGIGDGRNSLFLAAQGWDVTGFDISDVGIKQARERAQSAGLKLNALVDDVDQFHYGQERWDLVVGMYEHEMITRNAEKIIGSLKHRGLVVVEGLHRDANQKGVEGDYYGYRSNELLRAFDRLRILRYEESKAVPYWTQNGRPAPIVRFLAIKE